MEKFYDDTLRALSAARRAERYSFMRGLARALLREATREERRVHALIRSRVLYELHMGSYQNAAAMKHGTRRAKWLKESMSMASESAHAADIAGDELGILFAEMNISGLLMPALGEGKEGLALSRETASRAESVAKRAETEEERMRALRVAVNCYIHQGRLIVEYKLDRDELIRLRSRIMSNPVYQQEFKGLDSIKADMASFDAYIRV